LVSTTGTAGPGPGAQAGAAAGGTQVTEDRLTVAGITAPIVTVENPQTVVKPATVEHALTLTAPTAMAEVMVSRPVALIEAPAGELTTDQVTVCEGPLVPTTAAESCNVVEPVCGLLMVAEEGLTLTEVTVGGGVTGVVVTMTVALPQTAVLNVEQASIATVPAVTAVTRPVLAPTVAMAVLVERQVTVVTTPTSAFTDAVIWRVVPTWIVAGFGPTVMLWTVAAGGGAGGVTVTSSPHAATPAATRPDHSRER
jgi:hypothetical protein